MGDLLAGRPLSGDSPEGPVLACHILLFRIGQDDAKREAIEVLRVLPDAMDLPRHLPPIDEMEPGRLG